MPEIRPERLNLAIARRCFVTCRGCYQFFGQGEPDLKAVEASVSRFVRLGITAVTLSGGDPLTIRDLFGFIERLRAVGVKDIKLDTVGTALFESEPGVSKRQVCHARLRELLTRVDHLGLPLDGWSNRSAMLFRVGRAALHEETVALLDAIDSSPGSCPVVINTVVHRLNVRGLPSILREVSRHGSVTHWNLFQYTPTDQSSGRAGEEYSVNEQVFARAGGKVLEAVAGLPPGRRRFTVEARSVRSRLGQYLLINSDGECWLPDQHGRSVRLGSVAGREEAVLASWNEALLRIRGAANVGTPPLNLAGARVARGRGLVEVA
jgi:MoaA/NifB/PqqE/SkfB family radical SAM enzyme